jgi:hypothetical protein
MIQSELMFKTLFLVGIRNSRAVKTSEMP